MKRHLSILFLFITTGMAGLGAPDSSLRDAVYVTSWELFAQGDFDGNNTLDIAMVERASGTVRIGYRAPSGSYTWSPPVSSGIPGVSDMTVGRVDDPSIDRLILTSRIAQRVHWLDLSAPGNQPDPVEIPSSHLGPARVVAVNISGAGDDPTRDDLLLLSVLESPPNNAREAFLRLDTNGHFSAILRDQNPPTGDPLRAHRVRLQSGLEPTYAILTEAPGQCVVYDVEAPPFYSSITSLSGLPDNLRLLNARWNRGSNETQFLFYQPGTSNISVSALSTNLALQAPTNFTLSAAYQQHQLLQLPGTNGLGFVSILPDRSAAHVYRFDGIHPPVALDPIFPEPGTLLTAILAGEAGTFQALQAPGTNQPSSRAQTYDWDGTHFIAASTSSLPSLSSHAAGAQLFYFNAEPWVDPAAALREKRAQPDWTRDFTVVAGGTSNQVQVWTSQDTVTGLVPGVVALLPMPAGTTHGWSSQIRPDISVIDRDPVLGRMRGSVAIQPPAGDYEQSFTIHFEVSPTVTTVLYRFQSDVSWTPYTTPIEPPSVLQPFDIYYYGEGPDGPTRIYQASYQWIRPAGDMDSDGDSVPDFVERDWGLDPTAGSDSDGDGFSDFEELLAGTDPANPASLPAAHDVMAFRQTFAVELVPQSHDGTLTQPIEYLLSLPEHALSHTATPVRVHSPGGVFLNSALTANGGSLFIGTPEPSAYIDHLPATPADGFVVAGTPRNFSVHGTNGSIQAGRELIRIIKRPPLDWPDSGYVFGGNGQATEAAAWLSTARSTYTNLPEQRITDQHFNLQDSLHFVLVEKILGNLLYTRGTITTNRLTLSPWREGEYAVEASAPLPPEGARIQIDETALLSLQNYSSPADHGYRLDDIILLVRQQLNTNSAAQITMLKSLAEDIYRLSATAVPTNYSLISPIDALREFVDTGKLPGDLSPQPLVSYAAETSLTSSNLALAAQAYALIESQLVQRPIVEIEAEVNPETFALDCPLVSNIVSGALFQLIQADGHPYPLPSAIPIIAGSRLLIRGFTDRTGHCPEPALEVVELTLLSLPAPDGWEDANGNLLPDEWETSLLGITDANPLLDHDGDGYSDLQEYLEGTDPLNPNNFPGGSPINLEPPPLSLQKVEDVLILSWAYPGQYQNRFTFQVEHNDGSLISGSFNDHTIIETYIGSDTWEAILLPSPFQGQDFYRFRMILRGNSALP